MRKKNSIIALLMACLLVGGAAMGWAQTTNAPSANLTGKNWMNGDREGKLSFLYGASSVIAIEEIGARKSGKPASVFVEGWTSAFKNMTYPELLDKIDGWYTAHPEQIDRNVFSVIWNEIIVPANRKK